MSHRELESDGLWDMVRFPRPCSPPPPRCLPCWPNHSQPPRIPLCSHHLLHSLCCAPAIYAPCRRHLSAPPPPPHSSPCQSTLKRRWEAPEPPSISPPCPLPLFPSLRCAAALCTLRHLPSQHLAATPALRADSTSKRRWEAPEPPSIFLLCPRHHLPLLRCAAALCAPLHSPSQCPAVTLPSARQSHLKATLGGPRASQHCSPMSSPPPPAVPPPSARPSTRHLSTAPPPLPRSPMSSPSSLCCAALRPSARPSTRHLSAPLPLPRSPMSSPPPSTALRRRPLPFVISTPRRRRRRPALPCPPHRLLLLRCAAALCAPLHSPSQRPAAAAAPLSHVLPTSSLCCVAPPPSVRPSTRHLGAPLPLPRSPMSSPPPPSAALRHRPLRAPSLAISAPRRHCPALPCPPHLLPLLRCAAALCAPLHSLSQRPAAAAAPFSHVLPTSSLCSAALPPSATRHLSAPPPPPRSPMFSPPPPSAALRRRPLCTPPLAIPVPRRRCPALPCPPRLLPLLRCAAALCAPLHSPSQHPAATVAPLSHVLPTSSLCCASRPPSARPSTRYLSALLPLLPHSHVLPASLCSAVPPPSARLSTHHLSTPPLPSQPSVPIPSLPCVLSTTSLCSAVPPP
ncbi:hypothetical protein M422DRAFT_264347 [Sphaerobolus stellatus SS14]|uniref:Uncharacterized protein n=1 Tax=Sphaerobolus stellatus (strain SS14) TaxID=990650 RepID=A0A0C9TTG4_SPHS4|nr:hypothetical protein M422DRAFT_264347 [Sphaerobolus stellatus SS14]